MSYIDISLRFFLRIVGNVFRQVGNLAAEIIAIFVFIAFWVYMLLVNKSLMRDKLKKMYSEPEAFENEKLLQRP